MKRHNNQVTHERLLEVLAYDPISGDFTWRARKENAHSGRAAGWLDPDGYRHIELDWVTYRAHRLAYFYMTKEWPPADVDHKNMVCDDNRWENLRAATRSQNKANGLARRDNPTGLRGVTKRKASFDARIMKDGKLIHLGCFKTADAASAAYREAAQAHFGEFSRGESCLMTRKSP
jgi:hypothetical protein